MCTWRDTLLRSRLVCAAAGGQPPSSRSSGRRQYERRIRRMHVRLVIVVLTILLVCLVGCAADAALRASPAYGAGSVGKPVPGHVCSTCRGLPACARQWCPAVRRYWGRWVRKYKHRRLTRTESRRALRVMFVESRCRPGARNPRTGCTGLYQLLPGHSRGIYNLRHGATNISLAGMLYVRLGWRPWPWTRALGWW